MNIVNEITEKTTIISIFVTIRNYVILQICQKFINDKKTANRPCDHTNKSYVIDPHRGLLKNNATKSTIIKRLVKCINK